MEWARPYRKRSHRHVSHLYGLPRIRHYPSGYAATCGSRLSYADVADRPWRRAYGVGAINLFGYSDRTYDYVRTLISRSMHSNLFGDHPPFQIDANFGGTAGLVEIAPEPRALFRLARRCAKRGRRIRKRIKGSRRVYGMERRHPNVCARNLYAWPSL